MVEALRNRFKRFRRKCVSSPMANEVTRPSKRSKILPSNKHQPPTIPPGEDEQSYVRHLKLLQELHKKKNPPMDAVSQLMEKTYAFRRTSLASNPHAALANSVNYTSIFRSIDQVHYSVYTILF